ncbi:MAG: YceI family protein [Dehalococcoidia bacterium]|nr:YceI family protein [Dehalococcoidia bacterium]
MAVIGVLAALVLGGAGVWYFMAGGETPAPVSLDEAASKLGSATGTAQPKATASVVAATIPSSTATSTTSAATATAGGAGSPTATAAPKTAAGSTTASRWTLDGANSFVGYRINEQLAQVGANTAVGRTSTVTGDLNFDGNSVTALQVKADMRQLKSDDSRRDNFLRRSSLETDRLPDATFVLAEPIPVSVQATEGASMRATARGDLTVHGVTKRVEIPVEGKITSGKLVVVGSLPVALADYNIEKPRVPLVLSIEDVGTMELSLVFAPTG